MTKLKRIRRFMAIETRIEAWLVIYAIALGAIERGRVYLATFPGWSGWLLALACTGVVFVVGGKLLDVVGPVHRPVSDSSSVARDSRPD